MKPEFGGGFPVPVVLYFAAASQTPPFDSNQLEANLIDETEQGYYVQPTIGQTVYFVPRSTVVSVHFRPREQSHP